MKMIFSLIVTTGVLFSQTITEQIYALEDASAEMRVELMNSIKQQLLSMNQEKRMKTIGALQKKLQIKHSQTSSVSNHSLENRNEHKDESTHNSHLEQHEIQEHMMNRSHGENSVKQQSFTNHRPNGQSEEHNGIGSSANHNNRR